MKTGIKSSAAWLGVRGTQNSCIKVSINHHFEAKVYTTGSTISGDVTVQTRKNVSFDAFEITFNGASITQLDMFSPTRQPTPHTFLQLVMPIAPDALPDSRIFEANRMYKIPFDFTIPTQLGTVACKTDCDDIVQEQHRQLPPTMGHWQGDDQASEMAKIQYFVQARITPTMKEFGRSVHPISGRHHLRVLPLFSEEPPLHVTPEDSVYRVSQTKKLYRNLISAPIGTLRALATQPHPMEISVHTLRSTSSSSLWVDLEFTPALAGIHPPETCSASAKLISVTHYSIAHINKLYRHRDPNTQLLPCPVVPYSIPIKVVKDYSGRLNWTVKSAESFQSSGTSSSISRQTSLDLECRRVASPRTSGSYGAGDIGLAKYQTTLVVPFTLLASSNKIFLPTFHSCFISRTYVISLSLVVGAHGKPLSLNVPLQVMTTNDTIETPVAGSLINAAGCTGHIHNDGKPPPYALRPA